MCAYAEVAELGRYLADRQIAFQFCVLPALAVERGIIL